MTKPEKDLLEAHAETLDETQLRDQVVLFQALAASCPSGPRALQYKNHCSVYAIRLAIEFALPAG